MGADVAEGLGSEVDGGSPRAGAPMWRRATGSLLSLAVVVVVFGVVLPRVADYGDVLDTVGEMTGLEVATLALVALVNLASYQPALMAVLPGLGFWQAAQVSQASTAVSNTAPAGAAFGVGLSAAMYRSWGFGRRPVTLALLLAGIWNVFAKLALPVVAVVLLATSGDAGGGLVAASVIGVATVVGSLAVFAAVLRSERAAGAIGDRGSDLVNRVRHLVGKEPIGGFGHTLVKFRRETIDLVRHRWPGISGTVLLSHLSLFLVLVMALRHVGVSDDEVSWQQVFAAFSFVRLLSALPITPGGVGVVELGMTAGLVAAGGAETDVVAAVLVYRALTYLPPIPLGAVSYLYWRRSVGRPGVTVQQASGGGAGGPAQGVPPGGSG